MWDNTTLRGERFTRRLSTANNGADCAIRGGCGEQEWEEDGTRTESLARDEDATGNFAAGVWRALCGDSPIW